MKQNVHRLLKCPNQSFFLFGPRGVGKSTWIKKQNLFNVTLSLLDQEILIELTHSPSSLRKKLRHLKKGDWVCIDEIQKIPSLLDEVHYLIEERGLQFSLTGSSARKLKRSGANLLAGRAVVRAMEQFSFAELKDTFDLDSLLDWGGLPIIMSGKSSKKDILSAYVSTYLREEIKEEGLVRKVEPFVRFLEVAGLVNGQILNMGNISRDAKVKRPSVDTYFEILSDTLLGHLLYPYRPGLKVREVTHPKFYWFDPGVARAAAGLLNDPVDSVWKGFALETWIFHELRVFNEISEKNRAIHYYRFGPGSEIDFIIETKKKTHSNQAEVVCVEVKLSTKWDNQWFNPIKNLRDTRKIVIKKAYGVYLGSKIIESNDGIALPIEVFLKKLFNKEIF